MKVKSESEVAQSCLTLSNPMDCSLPGFSVHGILQAKVLELGAIAFSDQLPWLALNLLDWWFSNLSLIQTHLEGLLKQEFLGPIHRVSGCRSAVGSENLHI